MKTRRLNFALLMSLFGALLGTTLTAGPTGTTGRTHALAHPADCVTAKSTPVPSIPFNPRLLWEKSPPVVREGGVWEAVLGRPGDEGIESLERGPGVAYLLVSHRPTHVRLKGGVLLVDPGSLLLVQAVPFKRGEAPRFSVPVPAQDRFCGERIRVQALIVDASGETLTNAFDLTLGR